MHIASGGLVGFDLTTRESISNSQQSRCAIEGTPTSSIALGLTPQQALFQEQSSLTTCRYDRFPEPEDQQLRLRVASVGCCSQFLQVVYGDHFR